MYFDRNKTFFKKITVSFNSIFYSKHLSFGKLDINLIGIKPINLSEYFSITF